MSDTKIVNVEGKLILRQSDEAQAEIDARAAELAEILDRYATLDAMTFLEIVATIDQRRDNLSSDLAAATTLAQVRPIVQDLINDTYNFVGPLLAWALKRGIDR
jgi:iron uptake system EfeUOB component EfeO/EfeM